MNSRIFFIQFFNNFSGSPRVLKDTILSLDDNQEYILLTSKGPGVLDNIPCSKYFHYKWSKWKVITLFRLLYAQIYIFLFVLLKSKKNDIIYINTFLSVVAGLAAKIKHLPIVLHIHETHSSQRYFGQIYNWIRNKINANEIFVSDYIATKEHLDKNNYSIIYNPISQEFIDGAKNHKYQQLINGKFNVLMICSLRDYKGIPEFIKLCNNLVNEPKIIFTLVLDASLDQIKDYFKKIGLPSNLSIHPKTDNPAKYYLNSSLLLNMSRPDQWIETFGLTIVEAMSFGIPCIVPCVGGPKEIIDDNVNGFRISCYEIDTIKNRIFELSNDYSLCFKMSQSAIQKSRMFSPDIYKTNINTFLAKIKIK